MGDFLLANPWYLYLGIALIIAIVLLIIVKLKKSETSEQEILDEEPTSEDTTELFTIVKDVVVVHTEETIQT